MYTISLYTIMLLYVPVIKFYIPLLRIYENEIVSTGTDNNLAQKCRANSSITTIRKTLHTYVYYSITTITETLHTYVLFHYNLQQLKKHYRHMYFSIKICNN